MSIEEFKKYIENLIVNKSNMIKHIAFCYKLAFCLSLW